MDMRVMSLVMKGCIPMQVFRRDLHGFGDLSLLCKQEPLPRLGAVIAEAGGVLPAERIDYRPSIALVGFQLSQRRVQIHMECLPEETVVAVLFCAGTSSDVLHVHVSVMDHVRVAVERSGQERRGVSGCRFAGIILLLKEFFGIREVVEDICDQRLLFFRCWRIIIDDLHAFPCSNVFHIRTATASLDVPAFLNEL